LWWRRPAKGPTPVQPSGHLPRRRDNLGNAARIPRLPRSLLRHSVNRIARAVAAAVAVTVAVVAATTNVAKDDRPASETAIYQRLLFVSVLPTLFALPSRRILSLLRASS